MTPARRKIIRRYIMSDFNGFIDRLAEATNIATFKQTEFDGALALEQRRVCRLIEQAGIELSEDSMRALHAADLPTEAVSEEPEE